MKNRNLYLTSVASSSASTSQQPSSSYAFESQSTPIQPRPSLQNPEHVQSIPPAIAMLPIAADGESLRTQLGIAWDSSSGSSQTGLTENLAKSNHRPFVHLSSLPSLKKLFSFFLPLHEIQPLFTSSFYLTALFVAIHSICYLLR